MTTIGDIGPETDWTEALRDVDVVVHLAARAHILRETAADPVAEFTRVNRDGTLQLARRAARCGVRRLVFVSSIGVNGEGVEKAYEETDLPQPHDPYSRSKWQAEQALTECSRDTGLEIVIVRPPLVFGPGVPGNFRELLRWTHRGLPLPLGATGNQRSLIYVDNLAAFITLCLEDPRAVGETFLVSDPEPISTAQLIRRLARAMNRPERLFPFPSNVLQAVARLVGKEKTIKRLFGSLVVSTKKATRVLGWQAPVGMNDALANTVAWYLAHEKSRDR